MGGSGDRWEGALVKKVCWRKRRRGHAKNEAK